MEDAMKAKDIEQGGVYAVSFFGGAPVRATVLEVPIVRTRDVPKWTNGERSTVTVNERRDGRPDGVLVRVEAGAYAGQARQARTAEVLRPWSDGDAASERARDEAARRVAALRSRLVGLGMSEKAASHVWKGEALSVESCTVALPFVEFEELIACLAPDGVA